MILSFLLLFLGNYLLASPQKGPINIVVDQNCQHCDNAGGGGGSGGLIFKNIRSAIDHIHSLNPTQSNIVPARILLTNGTYQGPQNTGVVIRTQIDILPNDQGNIIFDCLQAGFGLKYTNVRYFSLSGITIQNCVSSVGGALHFTNSSGILANVVLISNQASRGGALYLSNSNIRLVSPTMAGNRALESGAALHATGSIVQFIAVNCPLNVSPKGHLNPGYNLGEDTLGEMIANQFLWNLPGSEHFNFGLNIMTLKEEDAFRDMVYQVPPSLNAKAMPKCSYSTSTTVYESTQEMSRDFAASASLSVSGSVDIEGIAGNAGFSAEGSVATASSMATSSNQHIMMVELTCSSTFIEMDTSNLNFALGFLHDLANVTKGEDMFGIFDTYGTYFYKSSMMGGMLRQLTMTTESLSDSTTSSQYAGSATATFGASVNEPGLGKASGSASATVGGGISKERQDEMESKSSLSKIITYGGMPAAFAPSESSNPTTYSSWTQSVDLLPVPYAPQLSAIRNVIPKDWTITLSNGSVVTVYGLWVQMESSYYLMNQYNAAKDLPPQKHSFSLVLSFEADPPDLDFQMSITWYPVSPTKPEVLIIPLIYQHTDVDGKVTDFEFPNKENNKGILAPIDISPDPLDSSGYDENVTYAMDRTRLGNSFIYGIKSIINPVVFEFDGPNFMDSVAAPIVSLHGIKLQGEPKAGTVSYMSYIVAWETGEAIILLENQSLLKLGQYDGVVQIMYESARKSKVTNICSSKSYQDSCTPSNCTTLGCPFGCRMCVTDSICQYGYCCGAVEFGVGRSYSEATTTIYRNSQIDTSWYNFYQFRTRDMERNNMTSFKIVIGQSNSVGYFQLRLDWVLALSGVENGPDWKAKVSTFNIIDSNKDLWTDDAPKKNSDGATYTNVNAIYDLVPLSGDFSRHNYPFHNYYYPIQGTKGSVDKKFYLSPEDSDD
eukprot:gene18746-22419_t